MNFRVAWSVRARRDLLFVTPWQDAAWIASEVDRYAVHGIGDVRRVSLPPDGQLCPVLFIPGYRVALAFDRTTATFWVLFVTRAPA